MEWLATAIGGITAGPPNSAVGAAKMVYTAWVRFGDIVEPVPRWKRECPEIPHRPIFGKITVPRRLLNQWPALANIGDFSAGNLAKWRSKSWSGLCIRAMSVIGWSLRVKSSIVAGVEPRSQLTCSWFKKG